MSDHREAAVSVVIVNYNGGDLVVECLESIARHRGRGGVEVVVYDNGSSDGSAERIAQAMPGVTLVRGPENLGLCRAFNAAAKLTSAPYILSLDNDTKLLEGALDAMHDFLEAHPAVGAAGSNLYNPDMTLQLAARRFPGVLSGVFGRRSLLTRLRPDNPVARRDLMHDMRDAREPYRVDWHSAASLMMRRDAFDAIGGFDEGYFVYWCDADICARLQRAGYAVYNVPAARIIHDETLAGRKGRANPRMVFDFHRGAYRFYRNNRMAGWAVAGAPLAWLALSARAVALIAIDYLRWRLRRRAATGPKSERAKAGRA